MRMVLFTMGSAGDVNPMVGLGVGLKKRGHSVTVVTNDHFRHLIEQVGLTFESLGTEQDYLAAINNPDLWHPRKGLETIARSGILPGIRPVYDLLSRYDPKDTVLGASTLIFGARVAQEKRGFKLASIHLQPSFFRSVYRVPIIPGLRLPDKTPAVINRLIFKAIDAFVLDPLFGPETNGLRGELGFEPARSLLGTWIHSPDRVIGLFPDWYGEPQSDWPAQTELPGFIRFDQGGQKEDLTKEVKAFIEDGEPPVLFTAGTAMRHGHRFFDASIEACQLSGRRGLLLTHSREQLPAALPDFIRHVSYIPFSKVLPSVAAIVHHGGIGTSAQGFAAGIPHLIMPMSHDQPDNADRLKRLGVGDFLIPKNYRAAAVAQKLDHLLNTPETKTRCQAIARKIDFEGALDRACVLMEQLV